VDDSSELFWLAAMSAALLLGFAAGYIERQRIRYALVALLAFAPVLVIFIHGLGIGCVPGGGGGGEECFGTGFGIALFGMAAPLFLTVLLAGMCANRLLRRKWTKTMKGK
jgi:hypothetical protein